MVDSERFKSVFEYLRGQRRVHNQSDLAKLLNKQRSYISEIMNGGRTMSEQFVSLFCSVFTDVNPDWLMTGKGSMLRDGQMSSRIQPDESDETAKVVLLLPVSAQGGSLDDFVVSVKESECEKVVSPIRGVDFAMTVSGDSMSPEYPNGSRVFIKKINEKAFIEWGKVYVLDTCNGTVIKTLVPSGKEGYVKCVSINPDPIFAPFEVALEDIYGIYKVLLCMSVK